ncbi:MAG: BACON domain-containing protein [Candidatus Cryptobacteroides sp.]
MKRKFIYILSALSLLTSGACVRTLAPDFNLAVDDIEAEAVGGDVKVRLESPESWVAKTQNPWITVSPANGRGSAECTISIDSALAFTPREGLVRFELLESGDRKDIKVTQKGFDYQIEAKSPEITLDSYAPYDERWFDVEVDANVQFDVVVPDDDKNWLQFEMSELNLDRGARPRTVNIHFEWGLNFEQEPRSTKIELVPVDSQIAVSGTKSIAVGQAAAEEIEIGVKGDSLALIAINQALECWVSFDTSERMEHWNGVTVWKTGENKGRVRSASFRLFSTKEGIPFQVKYLTAAEELTFFGNSNTFLKDLDPGEHICELTQLKRLNISAYGLTTLPDKLTDLKDLEYLNLSSNNFEKLPDILTPENFPKLHSLILNANQRHVIYDLSNSIEKKPGGFINEPDVDEAGNLSFPLRLLRWDNLDTLVLSVNYLQGTIPDLKDDDTFDRWTADDVAACDTLPTRIIGLPKVLPHTTLFTMNLNRLTGELPEWLLYHPCLDLWVPDALVFPQEGKDQKGNVCGFTNEPANLDYYYKEYVHKKYNPNNKNND